MAPWPLQIWVAAGILSAAVLAAELPDVTTVASSGGSLTTTITMDAYHYQGDLGDFMSRAYNGGFPGPTLKFKRGDTVTVNFVNALGPNEDNSAYAHTHNAFTDPNTTNFHTHGLHISGEDPQDNVLDPGGTSGIAPGSTHQYVYSIPADHAPGIHWYHAHHHGSTALHVGAGASGMLLIEDEAGTIPDMYLSMETKHIIFQEFNNGVPTIASTAQDLLIPQSTNFPAATSLLTNGELSPTWTINQNQWYRMQIVFAGMDNTIAYDIAGCDKYVLAKDGVYLSDAPRIWAGDITMAPGSRVDLVVRCATAGSYPFFAAKKSTYAKQGMGGMGGAATVMSNPLTLTVVASSVAESCLQTLDFQPPAYLADLTDQTADHTASINLAGGGGTCTVAGSDYSGIWPTSITTPYVQFSVGTSQGTIQEWDISGTGGHPFHLHVTPIQIVDNGGDTWHQVGDWVDVLMHNDGGSGTSKVRFQAYIAGSYVVHCHFLSHEDTGCMGVAQTTEATDTTTKVTPSTTFVNDIAAGTKTGTDVTSSVSSGTCQQTSGSDSNTAIVALITAMSFAMHTRVM